MELKNENVDFIENTAIDIENVNPELIIKEEKEVDQDLELPPEDVIKPESPNEISDDMKSEKKEDIIDDIEDEDGLPNKLKNKKNSYQKTIPARYGESENQDQDYPKNDYSNYTYMRHTTQLLEMNTNESSDSSCGTWQGLSDRILEMTSAFLTKVMISLNPSSNISELETSEINVIDFDAKNLDQQFMLSNWTTKYPSTFIKFYSNRGMNIRSFDSKYYSQSLKDIGLRPHTIFGCVVDYLFRPAPSALSFITQYTSLLLFQVYLRTKIEHFVVSELPANSNLDNLHNPDNVINAMIESWIFSKTDYRIISSGIMNNESSGLREKRVSLLVNGNVLACVDAYHNQYCLEYFYSGIEELSKSYNECLEMNINLDEEFEESMQKNEEDELSDDTDEFRNNNTIDGLTKAILGTFANFIKVMK
ncbi:putative glycosyltransferase [Rhizophagus irregularis DAOM 181602=DAOM 197198]|nr:putative glycosyltransferase [Rhizophagus irregularis DAOM 181602=DAOM 197198]